MSEQIPLLISSLDEAKDGIRRFHEELKSPLLIDLLSAFRAWYAIEDTDGQILLAPSKFIGYQALTAQIYRENNQEFNGRDTEAVLSRWFSRPDTETEEFLHEKLAKLLSPFGKKPNRQARISTISGTSLVPGAGSGLIEGGSSVDAMMAFYRMLSANDQQEFRKRIM